MDIQIVAGAALNRLTSDRFVDFIKRHKLSDMEKLRNAMISVQHVLDDAEEKQIGMETQKKWLDNLKNAFFAADDLFDEIDYEATRLEREAESRSAIDDFRKFLRPRKSFKKRLSKILETIKDLMNQKDVFGLRGNMGGGQSTQRIPTTSVVETSNIFGRVPDREAIMEVLLSDVVNRSNNLSIISIVGLGGIGKTTLAQLIYNDERVQNRFGTVRGWVCVSEEFDALRITTDIAKKVAQIVCDDKTLHEIQVELKKKLTGKMFFLVLDDVWNEDFNLWEYFLLPLKSGGPGSAIIITTRNDDVAKTVHSSPTFHLSKLDPTDCWQIFCKDAFDDENPQDYPLLEKIGTEIVKRCAGLPLAVKVMGGVLRSKRHVKDWEYVLRNDLGTFSKDAVFPVLRLSYRYLPLRLKQCFAYCSIFPKDYMFKKEQLILLWMAEGFLLEKDGGMTMEEVGKQYFNELVSRSFFQSVINNSFVMNDLINDLARVVAGDFCFRFENQEICRTFERLRYFSYGVVEEESSLRQLFTIFKSHILRTFLPVYDTEWEQQGQMLKEMIPDLFLNQQQLRVLSLSQCQNLVELPSSISGLKHLRYLDLSATSIESLPESLYSFYNLQTLKLSGCENLAKLPSKMGMMFSMRHLYIEGTKLQEMPRNMGKLIKLQTLTDFFVGKREGCGVKELGSLQHLGGTLRIHNLQNVVNAKDAFEANIKCKKNLEKLKLYWEGNTDDPQHEAAVLDGLEPHTNIEVISINSYGGNNFPNWLESGVFRRLKKLKVMSCPDLKGALPSHLPSFVELEIDCCPQLQICYSNAPNFSSLGLINAPGPYYFGSSIYLEIINIQESVLEKIGQLGSSFEEITIAKHVPLECFSLELFPKLKRLTIEECPHFESFCSPNQKFFSFEFLTMLILKNCPKLKCLPERMHSLLPALLTLKIITCPEIETFSDGLPLKLQSLTISKCNKLIAGHMHWDLQKLTSLTSFSIKDYEAEEIECFPEVTLLPSVLISLEICNMPYLKSLNYEGLQRFGSLEKLIIKDCRSLQVVVPNEGLPSTLTHLEITNFQNFLFNRRFYDLTCLELSIWECPKIVSLPEEGLPPSLITLNLGNLQNLKSVKGLRHLTSLERLRIERCPHLKTLPEGLPSSLSSLKILGCPLLKKRYRRKKGKYWAKISHIPRIEIS